MASSVSDQGYKIGPDCVSTCLLVSALTIKPFAVQTHIYGMEIDFDDISDEFNGQGQIQGRRAFRWVDLCRLTLSCHMISHDVMM